jgi:hypothetical protein
MSGQIQFFVDDEAREQTFEGRVPELGEQIQLDDVRYRVRQVIYAYWTASGARMMANVYLDAVDGDEDVIARFD